MPLLDRCHVLPAYPGSDRFSLSRSSLKPGPPTIRFDALTCRPMRYGWRTLQGGCLLASLLAGLLSGVLACLSVRVRARIPRYPDSARASTGNIRGLVVCESHLTRCGFPPSFRHTAPGLVCLVPLLACPFWRRFRPGLTRPRPVPVNPATLWGGDHARQGRANVCVPVGMHAGCQSQKHKQNQWVKRWHNYCQNASVKLFD